MQIPPWLIAYSDWPGRYFVVCLDHPRWYYVFDHQTVEDGCRLQSQAFQSLTEGLPSEQIFSDILAEQAASVMQSVISWFEPLPICTAPEYAPPPPAWLFGTSPETFEDQRTLLALRVHGKPHEFAVLSFDDDGCFADIDASDDDFAIEAHEAFQLWTGFGDRDPTRQRFLP